MAQHDDKVYIEHILECIEKLLEYTQVGREEFLVNELYQDAAYRRLQTMAESVQKLSQRAKDLAPNTNWQDWTLFRNFLTHDYLRVYPEPVWDFLEQGLRPFFKRMQALSKRL